MLKKIKKHWFGIIFGTLFVLYALFLMLIFFAPRVDLAERGFVFCTKQMINDFHQCQNHKVLCTIKVMFKNNACDFGVINKGFKLWFEGKQETPWANYYFEPITEEKPEVDDEELKAYYQEHLDLFAEMEELNKNRIALEKQTQKEIDETPSGVVDNDEDKLTDEEKNEENK